MQHRIPLARYQGVHIFAGKFGYFLKRFVLQLLPYKYLTLCFGQLVKRYKKLFPKKVAQVFGLGRGSLSKQDGFKVRCFIVILIWGSISSSKVSVCFLCLSTILFLATRYSHALVCSIGPALTTLLNWYQTSCRMSSASASLFTRLRINPNRLLPYDAMVCMIWLFLSWGIITVVNFISV
jgi:hypothetical protein